MSKLLQELMKLEPAKRPAAIEALGGRALHDLERVAMDYDAPINIAVLVQREKRIRSIVNTSVDDGVGTLRRCDDLDVLREAVRRELWSGRKRVSLLKPLRSRILKLAGDEERSRP